MTEADATPVAPSSSLPPPVSLQRRLLWLSVLRVLTVTLLLGSAIVVNVNDLDSFADPTYLTMASMIIATYVASIVYALLLKASRGLSTLAYVQLVGDMALASGLIVMTGGAQSVFAFLLYLTIINAAIVLGRSGAFTMATLSSLLFVGLLLQRLGLLGFLSAGVDPRLTSPTPIYSTIVNIIGFYLISSLAGWLAKRLAEQGTELRRRELDIESLRRLHEDILGSISSGVVTVADDGHILMINRSAAELLAYRPSEVFGRPVAEAVPELADAARFLLIDAPDDTLSRGRVERWEGWATRHTDGLELFLGVSSSQLRDGTGRVYGHILAMKDLTQIRDMELRFQQKERLAAVGQLATAIAHEIRNPLASISGSVEMLEEFSDPTDERRSLMNIVMREIARLNTLIGGFLDYAGPRREIREPVVVAVVLEETLELCRHDTDLLKQARLEAELDGLDHAVVLGDAQALRQVVWNLLRNGAEAIQGPGTLSVRTRRTRGLLRDGRWLDGGAAQHGADLLEISVTDTGAGIPQDQLDRIFQPFFTTKPRGTGLGLATVNRIIEDHNGQIDVRTALGQGTTFSVLLPLQRLDATVALVDAPVPIRDTVPVEDPPGWK